LSFRVCFLLCRTKSLYSAVPVLWESNPGIILICLTVSCDVKPIIILSVWLFSVVPSFSSILSYVVVKPNHYYHLSDSFPLGASPSLSSSISCLSCWGSNVIIILIVWEFPVEVKPHHYLQLSDSFLPGVKHSHYPYLSDSFLLGVKSNHYPRLSDCFLFCQTRSVSSPAVLPNLFIILIWLGFSCHV
jgi:hypothetical protein